VPVGGGHHPTWAISPAAEPRENRPVHVRQLLEIGGIAAGVILIGFGIAVIVLALSGRSTVRCNIAGQPVDDGDSTRCFAEYMRVHALEATGGLTYSQMRATRPRTARGQTTRRKRRRGRTAGRSTTRRNVWVTETARATALNVSYMASQLSLFSLGRRESPPPKCLLPRPLPA
jgi:hypothetical protein